MFFWWWFWWNLDGVLPENSLKTTFFEDTLWLFNIAMENHHLLYRNHLFLWAIYTMVMLNNQVVILAFYHCLPLFSIVESMFFEETVVRSSLESSNPHTGRANLRGGSFRQLGFALWWLDSKWFPSVVCVGSFFSASMRYSDTISAG